MMRGIRWAVNIAAWEPSEQECCRAFAAIQAGLSDQSIAGIKYHVEGQFDYDQVLEFQ
jgi:hypothetical protein